MLTDAALTIDMAVLAPLMRAGACVGGELSWSRSGDVFATVSFLADLRNPEHPNVELRPRGASRTVRLITTRPYFGGLRWWFVCPLTGRRVRCLHLADAAVVGGRAALGLAYRCQRESRSDRLLRAAQTIDAKLGGTGNLLATPPKPKWMRWPTYRRLIREREAATLRSLVVDRNRLYETGKPR